MDGSLEEPREYPWDVPKDPRSNEWLEDLPDEKVYLRLAARVQELSAGLREGDGVLRADASLGALREMAERCEQTALFRESAEAFDWLARLAQDSDDWELQVSCAIDRARLCCRTGDTDEGASMLHAELARAEDSERAGSISELLTRIALIEIATGHAISPALDRLERAFSIARQIGFASAKGHALSAVGIAYALTRPTNETIDIFQRALLIHHRIADHGSVAKIYNNIGVIVGEAGALHKAIPYLEEGMRFSAASPDLTMQINAYNNNVRVFEMAHSNSPAAHIRERADSLLSLLPSADVGRLRDRTMIPVGRALTSSHATYASDPYIVECLLFVPICARVDRLPRMLEPVEEKSLQAAVGVATDLDDDPNADRLASL